jgi:hypothetical protein
LVGHGHHVVHDKERFIVDAFVLLVDQLLSFHYIADQLITEFAVNKHTRYDVAVKIIRALRGGYDGADGEMFLAV